MTNNPRLQSKEELFRRPTVEAGEQNPFAADPPEKTTVETVDPLPTYVTTYNHRGGLLVGLGIAGLFCNMIGVTAVTGLSPGMAVFILIALGPGLAAWTLSAQDLRAIAAGAMDAAGESQTRWAYWLGVTTVVFTVIVLVALLAIMLVVLA